MKRKRIVEVILSLVMLISALPIVASAYTEGVYGDLKYFAYDDYIAITGYNGEPTEIEIPSEIEGLPVTRIVYPAFSNCNSLTKVIMPNSIRDIGGWSFANCVSLMDIVIPDGVISIGKQAFQDCKSLTKINIPPSVTSFDSNGWGAFGGCDNLSDLYITDLAAWCKISFNFPNENPLSQIENFYINNELATDITIPNGVTSINRYTFANCKSIMSVTLPDSITSIENGAFENCINLAKINIPNSVNKIGSNAFKNCESLTEINIPNSVTSIGETAFENCSKLENIKLSENLNDIAWHPFENTPIYYDENNWQDGVLYIDNYIIDANNSVSGTYVVKNNTKYIANGAFSSCNNMESIILPDSLIGFGYRAFGFRMPLKSIYIPNNVKIVGFESLHFFDDIYYGGTNEQWDKCLKEQNWYDEMYDEVIPTPHFKAIGTEPPKIGEINIIPNSGGAGKSVEIPLDTVEYDSKLITVFSNGDVMTDFDNTNISAGDTSKTVEIPDNADNVKVFIWNSLEGMRPLCEAKTKAIE